MITYGYAKTYMYSETGNLYIQVRIPAIHGPYTLEEYQGHKVTNYTQDKDLPWYPAILMPHLPADGEIVALEAINEKSGDFIVLGLTGGQYSPTNILE